MADAPRETRRRPVPAALTDPLLEALVELARSADREVADRRRRRKLSLVESTGRGGRAA